MKSLRQTRLDSGQTLKILASNTGITIAALSNIETGKATPQIETRDKIQCILGKQINWIDVPTINTDPTEFPVDWLDCERDFRSLLHMIASLPEEQRQAFLTSAKRHLRRMSVRFF